MTESPISAVTAGAYTIPTESPESDGTLSWDRTTLVIAEVEAGGRSGLGYTYASATAAKLIASVLGPELHGREATAIEANWAAMNAIVRNFGRPGVAATAISALDVALWDLKAKLLDVSLAVLLPRARENVPVYGSGGFTSYSEAELARQLAGWAEAGCTWVKMKVGRDPSNDVDRVKGAAKAIGKAILFVDANGAYTVKQALAFAERFAEEGVAWFEEPVSSDDLEGLKRVRQRAPAGMDISAGEYGYTPYYFLTMLSAGAVDTLQADATRCGGITGFFRAASLADAFQIPFSTHCAPSLHLWPAMAAPRLKHMEWFHDHVRIEAMLFDGAPRLDHGRVAPDLSRPGHGLTFKKTDARRYEA